MLRLLPLVALTAAGAIAAIAQQFPSDAPFTSHTTTDRFGRTIHYYLSRPPSTDAQLPLILCIQGSGAGSLFTQVDGRIATTGAHGILLPVVNDRARLLVVEKPGVTLFESPAIPGSAAGSADFRREHTLERWTTALSAALTAALTQPGVDNSRVLVMGHSEGGFLATCVAAQNPCVTHVATLAGGGPTQLAGLIELVREGTFASGLGTTADERVAKFMQMWQQVLDDPDSADHDFLGHPHRRWTTFLASSPMEELLKTPAKVLIVQGMADTATWPKSADLLYAHLRSRGRDVTYLRLPGVDHAYSPPDVDDAHRYDNFARVMSDVVAWFLDNRTPTAADYRSIRPDQPK